MNEPLDAASPMLGAQVLHEPFGHLGGRLNRDSRQSCLRDQAGKELGFRKPRGFGDPQSQLALRPDRGSKPRERRVDRSAGGILVVRRSNKCVAHRSAVLASSRSRMRGRFVTGKMERN